MDHHGQINANDADWDLLADRLNADGVVTFSYAPGKLTSYVITLAGPIKSLGKISLAGSDLSGKYLMTVLYHGHFYFDLIKDRLGTLYLKDKLSVSEADAAELFILLAELSIRLRENL